MAESTVQSRTCRFYRRGAPLVWLGTGATTASAESVKAEVGKLAYLRDLGRAAG